eukprot:m51a1_g13771 putative dynein light chain tctex-type 1 (115) ;mRNA; f:265065-265409
MEEDLHATEQALFTKEAVSNIIKESIETSLQNYAYSHAKVAQWTSNVVESCVKRLTQLSKPFKYVVTCVIMQKNGAGLHTASACFWDTTCDGSVTYRWENKSMYCITSVFGLAI